MAEEHELADISREEAAVVLYRLADGVAVGSVTIGKETIAVPGQLTVEIDDETKGDERELEVDLEWPLDAEGDVEGSDQRAEGETAEMTGDEEREPESPATPVAVVEPGDVAASGSDASFELYEDRAGEWRWRLVHANGNVIADSGEGYSRKANAEKGLRSVKHNAPGADVVEQ